MTDVVNFDQAIDMSRSTAFDQGYIDWQNRWIYLVFNNGTLVTRQLPYDFERSDVDLVSSWGEFWHDVLKTEGVGPQIEWPITFRQRDPQRTPNTSGQYYAPSLSFSGAGGTENATFSAGNATVTVLPTIDVDSMPEEDEGNEVAPTHPVSLTLYARNEDELASIMMVLLDAGRFAKENFDIAGVSVHAYQGDTD